MGGEAMTPIPIPAEVATCDRCHRGIHIKEVQSFNDEIVISRECFVCRLNDNGDTEKIIAWITRKLTQPDTQGE